MYLNKQDTMVSTGDERFAPRVSYNTSVREPNQAAVSFPKVQPTNFNIDLSGLIKQANAKSAQKAQAEYNQGLGNYAMDIDEIVEGQRQGVYNAATAERMIRSLTGDYIGKGYAVKDLTSVRNAHDGGIYANEESRQKKIMEHEQQRQLDRIDAIRKANPGMQHLSDDAVERKLAYVDGMYDTIANYNRALATLDPRTQNYDQVVRERNHMMQNFTEANLYTNLNNMAQSAAVRNKPVTYEDITQMKRVFINNAMAMGMSATDATFNWEQAFNRTDLATLYSETNKDLTENTAFMKRAIEFADTNVQSGLRSTYEGMAVMNLPSEIRAQLGQYSRGFYDSFIDQVFKKNFVTDSKGRMSLESMDILGVNIPADTKDNLKFAHAILNSNVADVSYPPRLNVQQAAYVSGLDANAISANGNMSDQDLRNAIANADNLSRSYNSPAFKAIEDRAKIGNNPEAIAAMNELGFNRQVINGKKAGAKLSLSFTDSKRSLNSLMNSLQANRLRIDPNTGYFVMLEDTEGFLQSTGDLFASEGTRQTINKLNGFLDELTPTERRVAATVMTNGSVPSLQMGEAVWDTSKQSLYEKGIDKASNAATKVLQAGENLMKDEQPAERTTPAFDQGVLNAAKNLRQSAELEEYANRLEASVNSVQKSGAKTEAGKLENDKKLIEKARQAAKELRVSASTGGSFDVAGAQVADSDGADVDMLNAARKDYIEIPNKPEISVKDLPAAEKRILKSIEEIEDKLYYLNNYTNDASSIQDLTTQLAALRKMLEE